MQIPVTSTDGNVNLQTIVLSALALAIGGWELTRDGGPKKKDLLVVALGCAGLSFIVIVGYLARDLTYHSLR